MARHKQGFTIVELLIVILVIAILAALVIISYNGIRDNAIVGSLKSDLNQASKQMGLAATDNQNQFPSSLPSTIKPSKGNVLQLTRVADSTKSWCINAYGPNNTIVSLDSNSNMSDYLCPGATIGSPVGGTVPIAQRGVNLSPPLSAWTTSANISYDSAKNEMVCSNSGSGAATSPLIRVDSPSSATYKYEGYATVNSTGRASGSGVYVGTQYFSADGSTVASNTAGNTGNGSAPALSALSTWQTFTWSPPQGPNIIYLRLSLNCNATYTSDTRYRNPTFTVQ